MIKKEKVHMLDSEELAYFCTQLSLILKSGINMNDGLIMMLDDTKDAASINLLSMISDSINAQKQLHVALNETKVFPEYFISMIKIGEASGHLDNVLDGLAQHYNRETNIKNAVKNAVMHPVLLLVLMSVVVAVLLIKVLPIFKDVFVQINSQVGDSSSMAIGFATQTGVVVLFIIGFIILFFLGLYLFSLNVKGRKMLYGLFSKLFFFRGIFEKISISRFSSAMHLMLSSGFDTANALSLGQNVITSPAIKTKVSQCETKVRNNESFSKALTEVNLFPPIYTQMIRISYKSGMLDDVWGQISEKYDNEVNDTLNNIVSFIEPLLVGILTIIIGVILISILLPLMGVMSTIG